MTKYILIFLLLAAPAFAQDERRAANDENNDATVHVGNDTDCTGTTCDSTNCSTEVDDDPASPDALELVTETLNDTIRFDLQDPTSNPSEGANAQTIEVSMTTTTTSCVESAPTTSNPTYNITTYCNDVAKTGMVSANTVAITGLDQLDTYNFTYAPDGDCDAAGANLQIHLALGRAGGGGARRHAAVGAVSWDVTWASAVRRRQHDVGWWRSLLETMIWWA